MFITQKEYDHRRKVMMKKIKPGSAVVIFSAPIAKRSKDCEYPYRQNSNFWYFTGFNEPESVLVLIKNHDSHYYSVIFNRSNDFSTGVWFSSPLGQKDAPKKLGVNRALAFSEINDQLYQILNGLDTVYHALGEYDYGDAIILSALNKLQKSFKYPTSLIDWRPLVHEMRLFKSTEELNIMRYAAKISGKAHMQAMKKCRIGMFEYHLDGEIHYEFSRSGSNISSYNTIVGSGENSCILHYTDNKNELRDGNLVLIDAGCEYHGYVSDITRTFPVNGKFTKAQRDIYEIVLLSLESALNLLKPGISIQKVTDKVVRIMVKRLINLGILHGEREELILRNAHRSFFMHNLIHWIGLDVHDVGTYGINYSRLLKPGMVLAVEPGLYIRSTENVPVEYRGIGIRIEDNIVITKTGNENLTASVVKNIDEIESLMATSQI